MTDVINTIIHSKWEDAMPSIASNSVDLIITSPPYNVNLGKNKYKKDTYDSYEDNLSYYEYLKWMKKLFMECNRVLKHGGRLCVNVGDGANGRIPTHADFTYQLLHLFDDDVGLMLDDEHASFQMMTTIVWDKKQIGGSCLPASELINTLVGYKKICNIKVGDGVFTHKGRFKKVTRVFKRKYTGYMYKIKSNFGEEIVVTENHPILLSPLRRKCGKYRPKKCVSRDDIYWELPENIRGENYLVCPRYKTQYHSTAKNFNKRIFDITGVKMDYWDGDFFRVLGYYIGDGSVHREEVRFDFGISDKELHNCQDVEKICNKYGWSFYYEKKENVNRICVSSNGKLNEIMVKLGGKYAKGKFIHPFLFQLPFDLQSHLIYGLFYSNGYISKEYSNAVYVTISKKLAYQLRDILLRLKIGASITERNPSETNINGKKIRGGVSYDVTIVGQHISKLLKKINVPDLNTFKYKYSKMKVGSYQGFYRIKSVEKEWVNDIDVYNMEVEEDNSYVGKIAYHNCSWGSFKSPSQPSFPTPFEFIIVVGKGTLNHAGDQDKITVSKKDFISNSRALWSFPPETQMMKKYGHPAVFPEELVRRLLHQLTYEGDIVLDTFSGAGTTCAVAKQFGRQYIGIEMSEKYWETSIKRLRETVVRKRVKFTGKSACKKDETSYTLDWME